MKEEYKAKIANGEELAIVFDNAKRTSGEVNGEAFEWDIIPIGNRTYHIIQDGKSYTAEVLNADHKAKVLTIRVNSTKYEVSVKDRFDILLAKMGMDKLAEDKVLDIKAPMPGMVLDILVEVGQEIKKGDPIVVLEAMKMENVLKSPSDSKVKSINAEKGKAVEKNQVLVVFE